MVLAIGLVVDDAIVVRGEHPPAHRGGAEAGRRRHRRHAGDLRPDRLDDGHAGRGLCAHRLHQGLTGSLFREFAFTLAGAVVISGIIAVTLSPMMSSRLLKPHGGGRFAGFVDRTFTRSRTGTDGGSRLARLSARDLDDRRRGAGTTVFMFMQTPPSSRPRRTRALFSASSTRPQYATSDYTQLFATEFTSAGGQDPGDRRHLHDRRHEGGGTAFVGFKLKEWSARTRKAAAIKQDIQNMLNANAGVQAFVFSPPALPGSAAACRSSTSCAPSASVAGL